MINTVTQFIGNDQSPIASYRLFSNLKTKQGEKTEINDHLAKTIIIGLKSLPLFSALVHILHKNY